MNDSLLILGRQPALGLAELESLYGTDKLRIVGNEAVRLNIESASVNFGRLGGSIKLCKILSIIETTKWPDIQQSLERLAPSLTAIMPEGKITLGISAYELNIKPQQLLAAGLTIKKALRSSGRSVRLVPNQTAALNSAQVLHNKLINKNGCELVIIRDSAETICAQTVAEQDIESYTLRDRGRPKRDARVGMLPPKLAQIIVNLATQQQYTKNETDELIMLDPFCGTGVTLQEILLAGHIAYGTDLDKRMVEYSKANLNWLEEIYRPPTSDYRLEVGDATTHTWQQPIDCVACETYLGQPFSTAPSPEKLEQVRGTCNVIIEKFLHNIGRQIKSGTRLCLAVPAWQTKSGNFKHLPLVDRLNDLGYNRVRFEHVRDEQLLYYREDQIVARELLVITRK